MERTGQSLSGTVALSCGRPRFFSQNGNKEVESHHLVNTGQEVLIPAIKQRNKRHIDRKEEIKQLLCKMIWPNCPHRKSQEIHRDSQNWSASLAIFQHMRLIHTYQRHFHTLTTNTRKLKIQQHKHCRKKAGFSPGPLSPKELPARTPREEAEDSSCGPASYHEVLVNGSCFRPGATLAILGVRGLNQ